MVVRADLWDRFRSAEFWWMHAMVCLWAAVRGRPVRDRAVHPRPPAPPMGNHPAGPRLRLVANGPLGPAHAQPHHHLRRGRRQPGMVAVLSRTVPVARRTTPLVRQIETPPEGHFGESDDNNRLQGLADRPIEDPVSNVLKWSCSLSRSRASRSSAGRPTLTYEAAPPFPDRFVAADGTRSDVGRRYPGGQGRLPEGRPHGLRQPLRHGVVFRRGLHGRQPRPARHADRRQYRQGARSARRWRHLPAEDQAAVKAAMQVELQGIDLTQAGRDRSRALWPRRSRRCAARSRSRCCVTTSPRAGPRPTASMRRRAAQTADFLIYSSLTTVARRPGTNCVLDAELAVRAAGRQHADHQHLPLDLDQLLLHLLCLRRGALHLRALSERSRPGADGPGAGEISRP